LEQAAARQQSTSTNYVTWRCFHRSHVDLGLALPVLLRAAVDGKVRIGSLSERLNDTTFAEEDLREFAKLMDVSPNVRFVDSISVNAAAKKLGARTGPFRQIVSAGILPSVHEDSHRVFVSMTALDEFARRHISVKRLSCLTGMSSIKLQFLLRRYNVRSLLEEKGVNTRLYRILDLKLAKIPQLADVIRKL
jgi:hypothetical protein